jgi:magnesium chelatase family protein
MVAQVTTFSFIGIEALEIEIQVQICSGIAAFNIVGLPSKSISESKERIRAAFSSIGLSMPMKRVTVNLSPADSLKEGSHFDLAIALGLLVEMDMIPQEEIINFFVMGELSLDARIVKVPGILPAAIQANAKNFGIICPRDNAKEASWSGNDSIIAAGNLLELVNHFKGNQPLQYLSNSPCVNAPKKTNFDMKDIKGQEMAKRALQVAAAGRHHVLMIGPPGSGKSMLAKRILGIMPDLTHQERLEISIIASLAGQIPDEYGLMQDRPFREPHSSASMAAMVGGGRNAIPGEVTLAHRGILFLDELPEFSRNVLESLRQPIESKNITVARVNNHATYPANFQLIAAMNPCKCGYFGNQQSSCSKAPRCADEYQNRISGPLLDRFDIQIEVPQIQISDSYYNREPEESSVMAKRVKEAYLIQASRYKGTGKLSNADLEGDDLYSVTDLDQSCKSLIEDAAKKFSLSMRSFNRILKVARTIADLEQQEKINKIHLAEAISYRISKLRF